MKYIYESPDKGKTVFRRPFGNYELELREILVKPPLGNNEWLSMKEYRRILEVNQLRVDHGIPV